MAAFLLWVLGTAGKMKNDHQLYQANTERNKNVLSNFMIGWQMIKRKGLRCHKKLFFEAIREVARCAAAC